MSNLNITGGRYYSLEDFDNIFTVKLLQVFLLLFAVSIIYTMDFQILRTVFQNKQLQVPGNLILCCILVIDIVNIFQFTLSSTIRLIMGKVWLNKPVSMTLAIIVQVIRNIQSYSFAIGSIEKFVYCVYPFQHTRYFTIRGTLLYMVLLYVIIGGLTIAETMYREVVCRSSLLTCFGKINDRKIAIVILRYFYTILPCECSFIFLVLTFVSSLKSADRFQSRQKFIWRRMFRNSLSLLTLFLIDVIGRLWRLVIVILDSIPSIIGRMGIYYYIYASPIANPLIIILGNQPLRDAVLGKKKTPDWLLELGEFNKQRRFNTRHNIKCNIVGPTISEIIENNLKVDL